MMGTKIRTFASLPRNVSLEDLVPEDHFYRRLEARLDLSFVRELVGPLYAEGGRPSVDPLVYFKLQLVLFFEDLRSERQQRVAQRGPRHGGRGGYERWESPRTRGSSARWRRRSRVRRGSTRNCRR
jgi:hypothetical protein